jgi:hypothetical protein
MMDSSFNSYHHALTDVREKFSTESVFRRICDNHLEPEILELFWICYCSIGVGMTEPVEGWIRRSGERCLKLGWSQLGQSMISDAKQEAGHHLLMVADTKSLIARWNQHHVTQLETEKFLTQTYPESVAAYTKLHEDVISGPEPFSQIAIEFEIESLAVQYGSGLIEVSTKNLGEDFKGSLSFMQTHVTLDVEHSKESEIKLKNFIEQYPESLESLTQAGNSALEIYSQFLDDCLELAQFHYQSISTQRDLVRSC